MRARKMIWSGKKLLVTGGAGFIGSHLVEKLVRMGCDVCVADDLSRGKKENLIGVLNKINFYKVNLTNINNCLSVTKNVDYIFHLAASVGGIHYILKENVGGLTPSLLMNTNMLEAARINDVERYLFASSACVYRERNSSLNRFKEEDAYPANPLSTYGWAKLLGEIQCEAYTKDYGLKTSCVRIFNAYGERENLDPKWSHVIPSLVRKAILYPQERFRIFGDGRQERAFLYVSDCVDGMLKVMEKITNAEAINMGSEEVITIKDMADKIIQTSGKNIRLEYDLDGPQGTHRYCADTHRMKEMLKWSPKICLDEGLKRVYSWAETVLRAQLAIQVKT